MEILYGFNSRSFAANSLLFIWKFITWSMHCSTSFGWVLRFLCAHVELDSGCKWGHINRAIWYCNISVPIETLSYTRSRGILRWVVSLVCIGISGAVKIWWVTTALPMKTSCLCVPRGCCVLVTESNLISSLVQLLLFDLDDLFKIDDVFSCRASGKSTTLCLILINLNYEKNFQAPSVNRSLFMPYTTISWREIAERFFRILKTEVLDEAAGGFLWTFRAYI